MPASYHFSVRPDYAFSVGEVAEKYEEDNEGVTQSYEKLRRRHNAVETQLEKTSRVLQMMEKCGQVLKGAEFEGDLTHNICRSLVDYGGYKMAWLGFVRHDASKSVYVTSKAGYDEGYVKSLNLSWADNERGRGPAGAAIRTGRPSVCNNLEREASFAPWKNDALARGYHSAASFPLSHNSRIIGVISVYTGQNEMFDEWEVSNLEKLAGSVSFGIKTIRTRELGEAKAQAQKDIMSLFNASFENTNIGITLADRYGRFIKVNKAFCEMLGYQRGELANKSFLDVSHQEEREQAVRMMKEMSEGKNDLGRMEKRYLRKDGSVIWGIANISVVRAANGMPLMYIAQIQDITTRKTMEEQLRKNKERYETLLRLSPVGIFRASADGKYIFVNKRWREITGLPQDEAMGDGWEKNLYPDDVDRLKREWRDFVAGKAKFKTEFRFMDKHGKVVWVYGQSEPELNEAGEVAGFTGAITDITEKKNAEKQAKMIERKLAHSDKMMSLGTMVAGMAHEVNNPNNFIMVNAPQLERMWRSIVPILDRYYEENGDFALGGIPYSKGRERAPRLIAGIMRGSQRIGAISQKLTRYSRNSQQSTELISINDVVASAIELVQMLIDNSTYEFRQCFMEEKVLVKGRALELEQVVTNLLSNACMALPGKTNPIYISTVYKKELNAVEIEVIDHGVGVPPENLPRIMEPFFSTRQDSGGTGLGLFISYNIVRDHNGDLEISSETGKWTKVLVRLPAHKD